MPKSVKGHGDKRQFTLLAATLASVLVLAAADDSSASLRGSSDYDDDDAIAIVISRIWMRWDSMLLGICPVKKKGK